VRYSSIFVSNRTGQSWSEPELLGLPINENAEQYHPTTTLDGTLYFCSNRGGAYNIYRSKCENGKYSTIELLDSAINLHGNGADGAYDPYIAPDESYIIFSSTRAGGYGKEDQYISSNKNGHWTNPINLGPKINASGTEYGSYVTPDNKYYFFARWDENMRSKLFWVGADFIDSLRHASGAPVMK
jgi:Tol biopolymer transport system component